ncbi:MAG: trypsin-like serine protease [Proteobacteria bacterium]|nr:trypsin-like serine protease [Pseudomonadota bacterium]
MKNLFRYLSASLLLILGCKAPQASPVPPQTTTDIVIDIEPPEEINPLDEWFVPVTENNDPYPSVCSLHLEDGSLIGSGVLIRPNVVLTAGHCIDEDNIFSIIIGEEDIMVKDLILHPDYSNSFGRVSNDIGLIILECDSKYQPAKIGCVDWMYRHQNITTVGYSHSYKKYSKPYVFTYFGTLVEEPNKMKFIPRPATVWFGDSGGGVFAEFNGEKYVVGIISTFSILRIYGNNEIISECSAIIIAKHLTWIEGSILYAEMEQVEETFKDGR